MAHTPGPWSPMLTPDDLHTSHKIMYDCVQDHRRIGAVCGVYPKEDGEAVANALLISAAPVLLAALKYMVENAEAEGWSGLMISDAVAAIAKAEGGDAWDASMVGQTSG